ncbi:MAG: hypothetical protein RIA69_04745 [Cyclobacteriaceae bacterium]
MKKITLVIFINCLLITSSFGQTLFPDKFQGCNTERFGLESDTITARVSDQHLISTITSSFDEKTQKKIRGKLTLQVLVEEDGTSCLLSLKNDTKVKTSKMNIKKAIDEQLQWDTLDERVSPVILLNFSQNGIAFKRLGMNANKGVHELLNN